jgi:hypothetical protein
MTNDEGSGIRHSSFVISLFPLPPTADFPYNDGPTTTVIAAWARRLNVDASIRSLLPDL